MASVPNEILKDVLLPLDRWTLDAAQFTDGRFLQLITERMSDVCLRQIKTADFQAPSEDGKTNGTSLIRIDGPPDQELGNESKDITLVFSEFVQALRSSRVAFLTINGLVFTPELVELVRQTPIVTDWLGFFAGSFAELSTTQFQDVLQHMSPTSLNITGCSMRASQVAERLLQAIIENRVRHAKLVPVDDGSVCMTDDAIIDFCLQDDVNSGGEGDASRPGPSRELELRKGSFTKGLFKRIVEASSVSTRTQPLRIVVFPIRFKEEDLRDFAQHCSYRYGLRIYDFRGEQQGADAAMDLQIVLYMYMGNRMELIRAQRPNMFFR